MNPLQKLEVAGKVAIALRNEFQPDRLTGRKTIKRIDKDGNVVGEVTDIELAEKMLLREGIEIGWSAPGVRPKALRCECGMPYRVPEKGKLPKRCGACEADRFRCNNVIDGVRCNNGLNKRVWVKRYVRIRQGKLPICRECSVLKLQKAVREMSAEQRREKARQGQLGRTIDARRASMAKARAALTPEQRVAAAKKAKQTYTPQQRREAARKRNERLTAEQRSEIVKRSNASRSTEQRREIARKAQAQLTAEQRSEIRRKANATLTPEEKSEARKKAWATRRAKAAEQ